MEEAISALSALRLLILSPTTALGTGPSPFPSVLKSLTGEAPSDDLSTFAGYTSHPPIALKTKYYSKKVSLWCDELPPTSTSDTSGRNVSTNTEVSLSRQESDDEGSDEALTLQQWQDTMLSPAASEVRAVIGGIVLILPVKTPHGSSDARLEAFMPYLQAAHALREAIEDESAGRDVASIIILQEGRRTSGQPTPKTKDGLGILVEALESKAIENDMFGWDVACCDSQTVPSDSSTADTEERNEFGEKLGMARVIEVLEGIDWAALPSANDEEEADGDNESSADILGGARFTALDHELQQEMLGLKLSMHDAGSLSPDELEGEDMSAEQMDSLKSHVLAIRDTVAGMPQSQKEAFAKREIDRIMRDL